jgi:phosphate transport system protein
MTLHTTTRYDEELNDLRSHVLSMGERVQASIGNAAKVIFEQDRSIAQKVIEQDKAINDLEMACDDMTRSLLVRRQPAANDLRFIIACNKIVTDLERMGDLVAGICRSSLRIGNHPLPETGKLPQMIDKVRQQLSLVLNAFGRDDIQTAMQVIEADHEINELNDQIFQNLLDQMAKDPSLISTTIPITSIVKSLERIGDLSVSVAEMIVFMISGKDIRHISSLTSTTRFHIPDEGRE